MAIKNVNTLYMCSTQYLQTISTNSLNNKFNNKIRYTDQHIIKVGLTVQNWQKYIKSKHNQYPTDNKSTIDSKYVRTQQQVNLIKFTKERLHES